MLRFAIQHTGSPARIPTEIVGFEDRCPMHLDDRTKLGVPAGTRTPITGFVDLDLVHLDDKHKIGTRSGIRTPDFLGVGEALWPLS